MCRLSPIEQRKHLVGGQFLERQHRAERAGFGWADTRAGAEIDLAHLYTVANRQPGEPVVHRSRSHPSPSATTASSTASTKTSTSLADGRKKSRSRVSRSTTRASVSAALPASAKSSAFRQEPRCPGATYVPGQHKVTPQLRELVDVDELPNIVLRTFGQDLLVDEDPILTIREVVGPSRVAPSHSEWQLHDAAQSLCTERPDVIRNRD